MDAELIKTVQDLVIFVKDVSPDVWAIILKQQYIIAYISFGATGFFLFGLVVSIPLSIKEEALTFLVAIFGILFGLSLLPLLIEGFPRLLNPEYYALMALKP